MIKVNNVLIVDQSEILRLKVRGIISSPEINVLEAGRVETVTDNSFADDYSLHDVDLLILDIQFGEEQDFSLLNHLQDKNVELPVVILSSNDRRETVLKAYRLGACDYLLKPFEEQVLKAKVDYYLTADKIENEKLEISKENNIIDYFSFDLLQELSRTLRGGTMFSILKLQVKEDKNTPVTKNLLLSLMRGIDKIYQINKMEFVMLLPLTDKEGGEILFNRINDYLVEHLGEKEVKLDCLLTFPGDITKQVEQNKIVSYQHQIIEELFGE